MFMFLKNLPLSVFVCVLPLPYVCLKNKHLEFMKEMYYVLQASNGTINSINCEV